ncbi:S4 domain-containing protein [Colletotrichum higginsianum]|uniref:S4 domain-containing protein n=2 Tax=Colletotrichum higginsianum TaxID=80884 RepID=H1UV99_COLHI|nr:S4 domain-containing protein [Colletotrichum higginsianum IMI 349063]OBR02485.1 S4 domain-containing protein [Colletotrichum higginsianum IMI 349063]TID07042.1 37S ribosomal protein NAM9, mitochondrial [Colletotrichum higginsianum]GJD00463.1 S4 domain-containing protein [Colletotrichum higginsianum]CCF31900.1 S4 domain-containing protein [Colletotrichum higginsianum]
MRGRKPRWYSLTKPKIRQSWNKYNLYNLATARLKNNRFARTFFQQKWDAKSMTRSYHGAHIKESDWNRAFSRRLFSAVDMPPEYLATFDGSEQAAGRGSGLHSEPGSKGSTPSAGDFSRYEQERQARARRFGRPSTSYSHPAQLTAARDSRGQMLARPVHEMTPYMMMAYAPLERRLDVAIFRAMFASSTLQAKQFCTHGAVKVNGKPMRYGSYKLNPGDMFQVDVDSVLYATGRPKTPAHAKFLAGEDWESANAVKDSKQGKSRILDPEASEQAAGDTPVEAEAEAAAEAAVEDAEAKAAAPEDGEGDAAATESAEESQASEEERRAAHHKQLKALVRSARMLIHDGDGLNPRKKRQLRAFMTEAKRAISSSGRVTNAEASLNDPNAVIDNLSGLLKDFKLDGSKVEAVPAEGTAEGDQQAGQKPAHKEKATTDTITELLSSKELRKQADGLTRQEQNALASLLRQNAENPIDESKPYWTPWEPRRYMAPFAFIPRYLEVNQNICAAVYLRHPVARRGMAEVPTPFPYETNQLAFNWYLRRH